MTPERQIEAMARIEGHETMIHRACSCVRNEDGFYGTVTNCYVKKPLRLADNYLTDYNAVHRVLRGLDDETAVEVAFQLRGVVIQNETEFDYLEGSEFGDIAKCITSTCAQMTEAILRACGVWVDAA